MGAAQFAAPRNSGWNAIYACGSSADRRSGYPAGRACFAFLRTARAADGGYAGNSDDWVVHDPGHADVLVFVLSDAFQPEEQHS